LVEVCDVLDLLLLVLLLFAGGAGQETHVLGHLLVGRHLHTTCPSVRQIRFHVL
jgi:hypothetical protein